MTEEQIRHKADRFITNEAWSLTERVDFANALTEFGIQLIQQATKPLQDEIASNTATNSFKLYEKYLDLYKKACEQLQAKEQQLKEVRELFDKFETELDYVKCVENAQSKKAIRAFNKLKTRLTKGQ